jgi:hypothetical protein
MRILACVVFGSVFPMSGGHATSESTAIRESIENAIDVAYEQFVGK